MYPNQGYGMPGYGMQPGYGVPGYGMGLQGRYMFNPQMIAMQGRQAFMKYDFNRNGVLSINELRLALNEFCMMNGQMPVMEQDLMYLLTIYDSDGSHQIDFFEFEMILNHLAGINQYDAAYVMQMRAQRGMRMQQYQTYW